MRKALIAGSTNRNFDESKKITQPSGAAMPRNSDAHERIAVPKVLCVLREHTRSRPKIAKVRRSDTWARRVSEPRKTVRG